MVINNMINNTNNIDGKELSKKRLNNNFNQKDTLSKATEKKK